MDLNKIYLRVIQYHFEPFYEYVRFFEGSLQKEKVNVSEKYEEAMRNTDPDEEYYYVLQDSYSEDYQMIENDFTRNFRSFLLTQIYSTVEFELVELCKRLYEIKNHAKPKVGWLSKLLILIKVHILRRRPLSSLDNLKREPLKNARRYLTKESNVSFKLIESEWHFLMMMRKIRNAVVHNSSATNDKALIAYLKNVDFIKLEIDSKDLSMRKICIVSPETNIIFLDKMKKLFNGILPQINLSRTV